MSNRRAHGPAIKAIRELKAAHDPAFRQSHFSIKCLITPGQLCNIEAERRFPSEEVLYRIATHLGVPVAAISYTTDDALEATA